ncbi:unnamed protein product [Lepidochelys kempii]
MASPFAGRFLSTEVVQVTGTAKGGCPDTPTNRSQKPAALRLRVSGTWRELGRSVPPPCKTFVEQILVVTHCNCCKLYKCRVFCSNESMQLAWGSKEKKRRQLPAGQ